MSPTATKPRSSSRNGSAPPAELFEIPVDRIITGDNVRVDVGDVDELAASIQQHGILQPLRVEPGGDSLYLLKIGHRRFAAAKQLRLSHVPAIVDSTPALGPVRAIEQLVENVQRRDLNPIEEAKALRRILDESTGMTQDELAKQVGRSRPAVTNLLRILDLQPKVQELIASGQLTAAHGKALASLKGEPQRAYAQHAIDSRWSAHFLEERVQSFHRQQKEEAAELRKLAKWAEETEQLLIAQGGDKKTTPLTTTDTYGYYGRTERALKAMKARGWKVTERSYSRGPAKICDCFTFGILQNRDGKTQITRRCIVQKHYDAKQRAAGGTSGTSAAEERRARSYAQAGALQDLIRDQVAAAIAKLDERVGRLLLWSLLRYGVNDWVRDHKGDRKKPDAWAELAELPDKALVDELTNRLLKDIAPQYNIHLDWPAIAEAFGVELPEPMK